jgi:hypothetical protein
MEAAYGFYGIDVTSQFCQDGGLIGGTCSDFQDAIVGTYFQGLGHSGDNVGLRDSLSLPNRKRSVCVRLMLERFRNKEMSRNGIHGLEEPLIPDASGYQLFLYHGLSETAVSIREGAFRVC